MQSFAARLEHAVELLSNEDDNVVAAGEALEQALDEGCPEPLVPLLEAALQALQQTYEHGQPPWIRTRRVLCQALGQSDCVSDAVQLVQSLNQPLQVATVDDVGRLLMQTDPSNLGHLVLLERAFQQSPGADLEEARELLRTALDAAIVPPDLLVAIATVLDRPAPGSPTPVTDPGLVDEFVQEASEYLSQAEAALLTLERRPSDGESINVVFRAFHTLKGTAAFVGLDSISHLAHAAESLLDKIRGGQLQCVGGVANLALRAVDMLGKLLGSVEPVGSPPVPAGYGALLEELEQSEPAAATTAPGVPVALLEMKSESRDASIRVRTDRLDRLIDLVGELVIAHSILAGDETVRASAHQPLQRKATHAGKIVRELQDLSMSMRMVPLRSTFQKMTRLVRDLGARTGKSVDLEIHGEDTEIDRNMVDVVGDPLVHMIRNAVDHGIELPQERARAGKSQRGRVTLSARHAGGNVVVELSDDGRGLDRDRIVQKAIKGGLLESTQGLSDGDLYNLIFAPGFSTVEELTDVSGRGVGMDVVRRSVESLHGRIDICSTWGRGTTFSLRLPLTLAITDGMVVRVGNERYIIPTVHIDLTFRPVQSMLSTVVGRGELVCLRGDLLPMFRLHTVFDIPHFESNPLLALLVVVRDGERRLALLVDDLLGQQQVVAKAINRGLGTVPGISGAAILGDGKVGLILDVAGVAALARQTHQQERASGSAA